MLKSMQPFYTDGRRFLRLGIGEIDDLLDKGAKASIVDGTVTFTVPGSQDAYARARIFGKRRVTGWVNKFNERTDASRV